MQFGDLDHFVPRCDMKYEQMQFLSAMKPTPQEVDSAKLQIAVSGALLSIFNPSNRAIMANKIPTKTSTQDKKFSRPIGFSKKLTNPSLQGSKPCEDIIEDSPKSTIFADSSYIERICPTAKLNATVNDAQIDKPINPINFIGIFIDHACLPQ